MSKEVTKRQEQVVDFIISFIKKNDYSPTLEEIATYMEISPPAVLKAIRSLVKKNVLIYTPSQARSIKVADNTNLHVRLFTIPYYDEEPSLLEINSAKREKEYFVNSLEVDNENYFAFKVTNPTMNQIGIYKGDIALIKKTKDCKSNDIVLAIPSADDNTVKSSLRRYFKINETSCRLGTESEQLGSISTSNYIILGVLKSIKREIL